MTGRLQRTSLVDQAIEAMRSEIASGTWPVGDKIPTEPELVESLGIGRNCLREATRALVHAGLLETRQGAGTYVRATSELAGALRRRLSGAELLELLEVRRALEVEAARLAALRRTDAEAVELRRLLDEGTGMRLAGEIDRFVAADVALHRAIVAASGNAMLSDLYDDFSTALPDAIRTNAVDAGPGDELGLHDALIEAIAARDPGAAQAATVGMLDAVVEAVRARTAA